MRRHLFLQAVADLQTGKGARPDQLATRTGMTRKRCVEMAGRLLRMGWLAQRRRTGDHTPDPGCYVLTPAGLAALTSGRAAHPLCSVAHPRARPNGQLAPRLWRAIRVHGEGWFEVADLIAVLANAGVDSRAQVAALTRQVQAYLRGLALSGYLASRTGGRRLRYRLLINEGPAAPMVSWRQHRTFDPNSNTLRPFDAAQIVSARPAA